MPANRPLPMWVYCVDGHLPCAMAVLRTYGMELLALFVAAFLTFLVLLRQASAPLPAPKQPKRGSASLPGKAFARDNFAATRSKMPKPSKDARRPSSPVLAGKAVSSGSRFYGNVVHQLQLQASSRRAPSLVPSAMTRCSSFPLSSKRFLGHTSKPDARPAPEPKVRPTSPKQTSRSSTDANSRWPPSGLARRDTGARNASPPIKSPWSL
jgi:hypothetical protein